jgi:hypothetical protein
MVQVVEHLLSKLETLRGRERGRKEGRRERGKEGRKDKIKLYLVINSKQL